jgi:SMC interacting uncharacterized protein involved in chromosome segregation
MLFRRNPNDDDTLDYDVPMENEPDNIDDSQDTPLHNWQRPSHLSFDPWKKINGMQKVINALNENIGSIKGQLAGYKVLREKYEALLREKVELEYKVNELGINIEHLNGALASARTVKSEDQEMLGYALRMHPDFLEWYTKEKAKNTVNSYEAQIEILKAKIATIKEN